MSFKKVIQYIITIITIVTISGSNIWFWVNIKLPLLENDHISLITRIQYHTWKWYARFKKWYCTDYAASRRKDLFPLENGLERAFWWSAIERYKNAQKVGVNTWKEPIIWAIAIFKQWQWASTEYWHVAIVEKILTGDMIEVSDMNYLWRHIVTTRIIPSSKPIWYIYSRKDIKSQLKYVPSTLIHSTENLWKRGILALSFSLSWDYTETTVWEKKDYEQILWNIILLSQDYKRGNRNIYHCEKDIITYLKEREAFIKYQCIQQQTIDAFKENILIIPQIYAREKRTSKIKNNSPPPPQKNKLV